MADERKKTKVKLNAHNAKINKKIPPLSDKHHYLEEEDAMATHKIQIARVVHFTENSSAKAIGETSNFSFQPHAHTPPTCKKSSGLLTWFAPSPPKQWKGDMTSSDLKKFVIDKKNHRTKKTETVNQFRTSAIFDGESLCGPIGFELSWKDLLKSYAESRGKTVEDIELRTYGTFFYKLELMFAIIVCCKGDHKKFPRKCDLIGEEGTVAFQRVDGDEHFIWKCFTCTNGWNNKDFPKGAATWDHVSFALYFPNEEDRLQIKPELCEIVTKKAVRSKPESRTDQTERTPQDRIPNKIIVKDLEDKCRRAREAADNADNALQDIIENLGNLKDFPKSP